MGIVDEILSLVEKHEEWRGHKCINLIPSENVMSPKVRSLLSTDLAHRYTARDKFYMGTKYIDEIEELGEKIAKEVFGGEYADLRPLSGHVADMIILGCLTEVGDTIMCVSEENGGYPGLSSEGAPKRLKLKVEYFPYSIEKRNIIIEEAEKLIIEKKPKLLFFGASFMLFPHPVKELAKAAEEVNATVVYDGSHVLGLIAGGEFQDPLKEGAKILVGSTHKTLFGPQGGLIVSTREYSEKIERNIMHKYVDNAHWNRIAALTLALAEIREYGKEYAKQVVKNAVELARSLSDIGLPVACEKYGFTKCHQILLDYGSKGYKIAKKLEEANIIVDCGVRLGTSEVTRRGMKENEMRQIAEFIGRILVEGEKPEKVKFDVVKLAMEFQEVEYCFK